MSFIDLGIPADAVESRTAAVCTNSTGESRIVIAAKGFLLVVDPITEDCQQFIFPNHYSEYPYDCFSSSNGIFYVGAGTMFYAFDPFQLAFIDLFAVGGQDELCGFSYAENDQGHIYMASYPQCRLYRYRPHERDIISLGSIDSEQKYPSHMAVDSYGWVYIGTGTLRKNILAYDPCNGLVHPLLADELRTTGIGLVRQGYGHSHASAKEKLTCHAYAQIGEQWCRLEQGIVVENLSDDQVPASLYMGASFGKFHRQLKGEWEVISHSLSDRELILQHLSGQIRTIKLQYTSEGAALSPIFLGPNDTIYGTSNHPLHFYTYEPDEQADVRGCRDHYSAKINNMGPKVIQHGAGGNLAAYATQGNILAGAAYPGGRLHLFDTSQPIQLKDSNSSGICFEPLKSQLRNPICVTEHLEIHRPRCAVALRDGEHIAYGGFPGYGMVGGGLCIYHLPSSKDLLIQHTELVPDQSTVALAEAPDGCLIGGTSIETPGGAEPLTKTAAIYALDWQNRTILKSWQLRENIREYSLLLIDYRGWIHTLTSCSTYFVWDPVSESIFHEENLSAWGSIVRQGWQLDEEKDCIYGVLSNAIFKIPLDSMRPERLAIPPSTITSGFVKRKHQLFFTISTHLWSYTL